MYLFTRRTCLSGGIGMVGVEWAGSICAKVKELTGQDIELWARVFSPGFGTILWTGWFPDLAALETVGDKLDADPTFAELAAAGAKMIEGGFDDELVQPIYGEPDGTPVQYVSGAVAVPAAGNIERALVAGVEMARTSKAITGLSTLFVRSLTGPYGGVGWLTGYGDVTAMEGAGDALAGDPSWLKLLDSTTGCFVEDASVTQATIYRKLGWSPRLERASQGRQVSAPAGSG